MATTKQKDDEEKVKKAADDQAKKEHDAAHPSKSEKDDHRNVPKSPEAGKAPEPYPPDGPLPVVEGEVTEPVFPIGTEAKNLTQDKPKGKGDTDIERMENATKPEKTPEHCPTCRGRGFIGGAECPDCGGTGLKAGKKEAKKEDK